MRIAILGATSQIAKDLVLSFSAQCEHELTLFARRPGVVTQWLANVALSDRYAVADFAAFGMDRYYDAIINFVGAGNPAQIVAMAASIFDTTLQYDQMALNYVRHNPQCRYLFLSSGTAYGSSFEEPVDEKTKAVIAINNLQSHEWYAVAKLHTECRHRTLPHLPLIDIRVFNYFSGTQDISARYLITDILRAIKYGETLITSPDNVIRDYIAPDDFYQLVSLILTAPATNDAVDCYTKAPVDKMTLLSAMKERFGLAYEVRDAPAGVNATGIKKHYYSRNCRAAFYGYKPTATSLCNVVNEAIKIISNRW